MSEPRSATPRGPGSDANLKATKEIAAEAAVWIARLHGPSRDRKMEQAFRDWQARSSAHREAFEHMTDVWEDVAKIKVSDAYRAADAFRAADASGSASAAAGERQPGRAARWVVSIAAAGSVALAVVLFVQWRDAGLYSTEVGEQRTVLLKDGSRVLLNTSTQLRVDLQSDKRLISVSRGEAYFEVAKDPNRPFVVRVAGSEVVAVGTAFLVRYATQGAKAPDVLDVTLVEGQVNVRPAQDKGDALAPEKVVVMKAGDRLQLDRQADGPAGTVTRVDRPNLAQVTAWKRNESVFDDTPLAEAVAEMNRYNRTPIVLLDGLASSSLRVSGVYRISDGAGFASAVAALHNLRVRQQPGRMELMKPH